MILQSARIVIILSQWVILVESVEYEIHPSPAHYFYVQSLHVLCNAVETRHEIRRVQHSPSGLSGSVSQFHTGPCFVRPSHGRRRVNVEVLFYGLLLFLARNKQTFALSVQRVLEKDCIEQKLASFLFPISILFPFVLDLFIKSKQLQKQSYNSSSSNNNNNNYYY